MGGLWKLSAMSAVIGAGLIAVWQAQASLNTAAEPEIPLASPLTEFSNDAADSPTLRPDAVLLTHSPAKLTPTRSRGTAVTATPISETTSENKAEELKPEELKPLAANASVPPEENVSPELGLLPVPETPAEAASSPTEPVPNRYSRGLDFRRSPDLNKSPKAEQSETAVVSNDAADPSRSPTGQSPLADDSFPALAVPPQGDVINQDMIQPAATSADQAEIRVVEAATQPGIVKISDGLAAPPRRLSDAPALPEKPAPSKIQLTAGEEPLKATPRLPTELPDSDPFFDAAPPAIAAPASPATPSSAGKEPASIKPSLPTDLDVFDPFAPAEEPQPMPAERGSPAMTPSPNSPASVAPSETELDPFADSAPRLPSRQPVSRQPESLPVNDENAPFGNTFDEAPPMRSALPTNPSAPAAADNSAPNDSTPNNDLAPNNVEPFDPFGEQTQNPTAVPVRTAPSRSAMPLPVDLDQPAPATEITPAPVADQPFDPFGESPSTPTATDNRSLEETPQPTRTSAPSVMPPSKPRISRDGSSTASPTIDLGSPAREPAQPSRLPEPAATSQEPLFQGDGELPDNTPRGIQEPRLTIEKFAPPSAVLGQPLVYSVIVKNVGGSPANQVTVEDRIPKGTRLVGTAPQAEMIDKRLVWRKLGTLQPGEECKISIKVIPEEEGPIGSVAKVTFISEVAAEIVVQAPKLKVAVNIPTEVKVGSTVPLVFQISNTGNGKATNVVLRSIIPDGLQHPAGKDLEYSVGVLAPQEQREVRLEVTATRPGKVTHQTIITADGNLTAESKDALEIIGEQLLLTRSGHERVYLGRNAVFTNSVTNEGQRPVSEIQVREQVPVGFEFVSATHDGRFSPSDRMVSWNLGALAPGASTNVSVTLVAKSVGRFDTTVSATGPGGSVATVRPNVSIEGYPALALERLGDERLVGVGETITTKIQLQNRGSGAASGVGLTVDLPTELKLVSATGPSSYRQEGQRLIFEPVEQLDARGSAAYELVLEAKSPGDSRLEMQVSAEHLRRPVRHDEALQVLPALR